MEISVSARQVAPVVVKVPEDAAPVMRTTASHRVVTCPQRYRRSVTCAVCELCSQAWYRHLDRDRDRHPRAQGHRPSAGRTGKDDVR